jgi:hypothetical protein
MRQFQSWSAGVGCGVQAVRVGTPGIFPSSYQSPFTLARPPCCLCNMELERMIRQEIEAPPRRLTGWEREEPELSGQARQEAEGDGWSIEKAR